MVRTTIISEGKANNLFWLGRYEERVYLTLHQLRKCYDLMIDGKPEEYKHFWEKLDGANAYENNNDFTLSMMYDASNVSSVMSAQIRAMDNAILMREDITSETLSYLEMSIALMKRCSNQNDTSLSCLQPIIDWSLAFWGSAEQRIQNHKALYIMLIGRNLENLDMLIRFGYNFDRVSFAYNTLLRLSRQMADLIDSDTEYKLDNLMVREKFNLNDAAYKSEILANINKLVNI